MGWVKRAGVMIADRYRLERELGAGAMGTVWSAIDTTSGAAVAVKFMSDEKPDLRARFVREAKLSKRLSHPNIVATLDVGETNDGEPFLVQECLTGPTLDQKLKSDRRFAPRDAARIVRDIARGVAAAHAAEIIHRDLKPGNVMFHDPDATGDEPAVKILDFGIAKSTGSANQTYATVAGMALGSPAYMSPEGLLGRGVDHRTDIWALGIILYELIVGIRPFVGSQTDVANQIFSDEPPLIRDKMPGVPDEIDRLILMCLQKSRDKRLSSASELATMLTQLVESPRIWQREPPRKSKPADADGAETLLWRPGMPHKLRAAISESEQAPSEGLATVVRDAPVTRTSRRRRETRLLVGLTVGVLLLVVGLLMFGAFTGRSSASGQNANQVGHGEPSASGVASPNSLEDQRSMLELNLAAVPAGSVSGAKPVGTAEKKVDPE